jgi:hypothetical protein
VSDFDPAIDDALRVMREAQASIAVSRQSRSAPIPGVEVVSTTVDIVDETSTPWRAQTWPEFRDTSPEAIEWLVNALVPRGVLKFTAGPPKKGKTWIGAVEAVAVATGKPLFDEYVVPEAQPVLYIALEGSRPGLCARIGALTRGVGLDPDGGDLDKLHVLYRPRPFNLVDLETATWLREEAERLKAALIVVDVLRAAVGRFRENEADDFARVREALMPLLDAGRTVDLLHHFGKHSDTQRKRSPGERMSGTGAMYGALDVGFLIVSSEDGARRMKVEIEARDFAAPDAIGLVIDGTGTGEHGGFTYTDTTRLIVDPTAAEERELAREIEGLFDDCKWRTLPEIATTKKGGIGANQDDVRDVLVAGIPGRFVLLDDPTRIERHVNAKPWGTAAMLRALEEREGVTRASESHESHDVESQQALSVGTCDSPYGESHRVTRPTLNAPSDSSQTDSRVTPTPTGGMTMLDLDAAVARARDMLEFADGVEDAGHADTARRSRAVARDLLELADELRAERSARRAMQTNYERALAVIGRRGYGERDVRPVLVPPLEPSEIDNPFLDDRNDTDAADERRGRSTT